MNGSGVENNSWITHPWAYEERLHPTNWVVDESIRFLETRDRTRPFFLMTSFVRPHPPSTRRRPTSICTATWSCARLPLAIGMTPMPPSAMA